MIEKNLQLIKAGNNNHYLWGNGWRLLDSENVSIIQEIVPPQRSEIKHFHTNAGQFFYILSGKAAMIFEGKKIVLNKGEGLEIPPPECHINL